MSDTREPRTPDEALTREEALDLVHHCVNTRAHEKTCRDPLNCDQPGCRVTLACAKHGVDNIMRALEPQALSKDEQHDALFGAHHSGDSAWETLQRLHADGYAIVRTR